MHKHPDADAFVLEHLRRPANATTRLAFADWLDDTGTRSNAAWAHYIRAREEAERHPPRSAAGRDALRRADERAAEVRAKLTLAVWAFARDPESVLRLIPAANVTLRLANFTPPRAACELVPESVARENFVAPVATAGGTLYLATAGRRRELADKLDYILNRDIVLVGAAPGDLQAAINRGYGTVETESFDAVLLDYVTPPLPTLTDLPAIDPVVWLVGPRATDPADRPDRVRVAPLHDAVLVTERVRGAWIDRARLPLARLRALVEAVCAEARIDPDEAFAPPRTAYPLEGGFAYAAQSLRLHIAVTIHPHPGAPTTELALTELPG